MKVHELIWKLQQLLENDSDSNLEVCIELPESNEIFHPCEIESVTLSDYVQEEGYSNDPIVILTLGNLYEWAPLDKV